MTTQYKILASFNQSGKVTESGLFQDPLTAKEKFRKMQQRKDRWGNYVYSFLKLLRVESQEIEIHLNPEYDATLPEQVRQQEWRETVKVMFPEL